MGFALPEPRRHELMSELAIRAAVRDNALLAAAAQAPAVQVPRRGPAATAAQGIVSSSGSSLGGHDAAPARAAPVPVSFALGTRAESSAGVLSSLRETLLEFMVRQAGPGVPVRKPELTPSRS